jgi:hypothetical protein
MRRGSYVRSPFTPGRREDAVHGLRAVHDHGPDPGRASAESRIVLAVRLGRHPGRAVGQHRPPPTSARGIGPQRRTRDLSGPCPGSAGSAGLPHGIDDGSCGHRSGAVVFPQVSRRVPSRSRARRCRRRRSLIRARLSSSSSSPQPWRRSVPATPLQSRPSCMQLCTAGMRIRSRVRTPARLQLPRQAAQAGRQMLIRSELELNPDPVGNR